MDNAEQFFLSHTGPQTNRCVFLGPAPPLIKACAMGTNRTISINQTATGEHGSNSV